jgi:holo-[acyl-carrier protein] synthase
VIYGIGTDLIDIGRIQAAHRRFGDRFIRRVLGPREIEKYHQRRGRSEQRGDLFLATRFAAKEAVSKALGLGMRHPMYWRAVEIVNDPSGRPVVIVSGKALREFTAERRIRLHVSVSDESQFAIAHVIAEVEEGG